jgi:hypothetical protein
MLVIPPVCSKATTTVPETTATRLPIRTPTTTVTATDRSTTPTRTAPHTTMTVRGMPSTTLQASEARGILLQFVAGSISLMDEGDDGWG